MTAQKSKRTRKASTSNGKATRRPSRSAASNGRQSSGRSVSEQHQGVIDRDEAFREFARRRAAGEVVTPPELLEGELRRLHIRQTLREDHSFRIHDRPEGAQTKFDKLAQSPFDFFRGTALLYYRDQAGTDGHLPVVFCNGDVHPENFGVMPSEDRAPFFGLNDFDESYIAPFSWDIKRGAVGFELATQAGGFRKSARAEIVAAFVRGYIDGLKEFARDDREKYHQFRLDNSPPLIRELLERSQTERRKFLEGFVDLEKSQFRPTDEIVPHASHVQEFQKIIDRYRKRNNVPEEGRAGHFKVKDVAVKKDSGTASLGLDRFFVLIDGPTDDPADDIVLELKQARPSALRGLTPGDAGQDAQGEAGRIFQSQKVHVVGGDPFYGETEIDGRSFLVRERSPFKDDIDIDDLDEAEWCDYARICGMTVAQAHARSDDDTGVLDGNAETMILESIDPELFVSDMVRFARATAKRIKSDYKLYKADHELGAYRFTREEWLR